MKKYTFVPFLGILLFSGNILLSCNGSSSPSSDEDTAVAEKDAALSTRQNGNDTMSTTGFKLEKQWETDPSNGLQAPESALWDAQQKLFYVSNINGDGTAKDGNGYISQVDANGKIVKLHWADGLDGPKGLGMYKGTLYAADIDQLAIIDMASGTVKQKVKVPGAVFLNDIVTDDKGNVYMSDTRQGKIYRYADGKVDVYVDQPETKGVNGLMIWKRKLWILAADGIYNYDAVNKKLTLFSDGVKGGDGLANIDEDNLIASRWAGEVFYVYANGKAVKLLDTKDANKNTADICYVPGMQLLAVPTFGGNTLAGYKLVNSQ